jgi:hypothetical protein
MKLTNCDRIFAKFLIESAKVMNKEMYGMVAIVFRALRVLINLYGYVLMTQFEQQNEVNIQFYNFPNN